MKFLFLFFVFTIIFSCAFAERTYAEPAHRVPNKPDLCYTRTYDRQLEMNKEYQVPGKCAGMKCTKDYKLRYSYCPEVPALNEKNCRYEVLQSKPFPECCKKIVC